MKRQKVSLTPKECINLAKNGMLWGRLASIQKTDMQEFNRIFTAVVSYLNEKEGYDQNREDRIRAYWNEKIHEFEEERLWKFKSWSSQCDQTWNIPAGYDNWKKKVSSHSISWEGPVCVRRCAWCGQEFRTTHRGKKYCSHQCYLKTKKHKQTSRKGES